MRLLNFRRVLVWVGRPRSKPITFEDLVEAETRAFKAEEELARMRQMQGNDSITQPN